jgi:hypothetical protein
MNNLCFQVKNARDNLYIKKLYDQNFDRIIYFYCKPFHNFFYGKGRDELFQKCTKNEADGIFFTETDIVIMNQGKSVRIERVNTENLYSLMEELEVDKLWHLRFIDTTSYI